jgi:mannitol/fructose-specific phosphotransferase system IIA component (Ntr-type)
VLDAVAERESEVSTRISPTIALPHARLPGMQDFVLAVGLSRDGVQWDIERDSSPVHVVALLLGSADRPREHVRALAELAGLFSLPNAVDNLLRSTGTEELFQNLVGLQENLGDLADLPAQQRAGALLRHTDQLAGELPAQAVIVIGAEGANYPQSVGDSTSGSRWILAAPQKLRPAGNGIFDEILEVPSRGLMGPQRVDVVILLCLLKQLIQPTDTVICVYGRHAPNRVDSVRVVDVADQFGELWKLSDEIVREDIEPSVLYRILQLANDIAIEGREGHPLGTLFVLGDYENVSNYCNQLVVNPSR